MAIYLRIQQRNITMVFCYTKPVKQKTYSQSITKTAKDQYNCSVLISKVYLLEISCNSTVFIETEQFMELFPVLCLLR
jgi:hypothetical protein